MGWGVLQDWVELIVRWTHVVAAIAWIGSSFYFIALDASLKPHPRLDGRVKGEAWQVHGGGFYNMQKYLGAPNFLPPELTWFKWEAYATWIFGFLLLVMIYYLHPTFCLLVAVAFAYSRAFSGRGAFIQVGALVGSIMVGNVAHIIIPNQRKVVAALLAARTPDPALGEQAKQRSVHNNYLTLPVVFVMISNHYAFTYQTRWNWLVLAAVFVAGFLVRHWFNSRHAGGRPDWRLWPAAAVPLLGAAALTLFGGPHTAPANGMATFAQVQRIVGDRCQPCHASHPTYAGIDEAPKGVLLDTPARIAMLARQILTQAVVTRAMPLGNVTNITEEERQVLAEWIRAGAVPR